MAAVQKKNFATADETRPIKKGKIELVNLPAGQVMRATFEPGWRWSESVKPMVGTDSCQVAHLLYVTSGRMAVKMDDGSTTEIGPGDMVSIPSGHDAWIVGDETFVCVDFQGAADYARP